MAYTASLDAISRAELKTISCFKYINPEVQESDLQKLDSLFVQDKAKPQVFSRSKKGMVTFFAEAKGREDVQLDWRVYRTWCNTFHYRYRAIITACGFRPEQRFFSPEADWAIATRLETEKLTPLTLADALAQFSEAIPC
ncbi:hypothetical protein [Vibrio sp. Hal054]|uniref:hypothetical protein n=1 Tax=Vibrio sp. Hal054 TaxID=3035158 RepID=UPI00301B88EA